jgi:hypothetical protein
MNHQEEINTEISNITQDIFNINCPTLDIGERVGETGYIDFIESHEFKEPFNKGCDKYGRKFISFRAIIEYEDGKTTETFTTLFQRYAKEENLWIVAGPHKHLFQTDCEITIYQVEFLFNLLKEKSVDVTEYIINYCGLLPFEFEFTFEFSINGIYKNKPRRVYLVAKEKEKEKEKLEDVMSDLEEKVNFKTVSESLSKLDIAIKTKDPSILLAPMQAAAKEFEKRVGRPMTYDEMRHMWG